VFQIGNGVVLLLVLANQVDGGVDVIQDAGGLS
jgi:hypothetical protein